MPKHSEIVDIISSFTASLEHTIDALVNARLAEAFSHLDVRATRAVQQPQRKPAAAPRVARPAAPPAVVPARLVKLPQRRQATVIPANIKITRLPPAGAPKQNTYSELRSQCRVPGCRTGNSGPRYDFFCRDHYRLPREDREKYKAMFKAAHSTQA